MNSLFQYLFTGSWILLVLVLGYTIFLRNHKLLRFTRFYLLGSLLLCLLFPLLPKFTNLLPNSISGATALSVSLEEQYLPTLVLSPQTAESPVSVPSILLLLYATGCAVALILYFIRLEHLLKVLQRFNFRPTPDGYLLAYTDGVLPTFSFFHYLVINKAQASTEEELQLVLQHEKAHARQYHSADVLLAELAQVILWFHPAVYMLGRAIRQTHEHLADAAVIRETASETTYVALMAKQGLQSAGLSLASTFFQSYTLNRIRMVKKRTSPTRHWRIAASLLLTSLLTAFVACENETGLPQQPAPLATEPNNTATALPDNAGIYEIVEEEAMPADGMQALYQHLYSNISYPQVAVAEGVEGTTYIRFVIDERGSVESAEAIKERALGYGLDEEAIRVIRSTKWTPAKQNGKVVKQRKVLPVKFMLNKAPAQESTKDQTSIKGQTSMLFKNLIKTPKKEAC